MKSHVTDSIVPLNKHTASYWSQLITQVPPNRGESGGIGGAEKTQTQVLGVMIHGRSVYNEHENLWVHG